MDREAEDRVGEGDDSEQVRRTSAGATLGVGVTSSDGDGASKSSSVAATGVRLTLVAFPLALDDDAGLRRDFCARDEGAYL